MLKFVFSNIKTLKIPVFIPHREICVRTYLENFQKTKNMVLKQTAIKIYKPPKKRKTRNVNPYSKRQKEQKENQEHQQPNKDKMIEVGANISVIATSIRGIIFHIKHA